MNKQNNIIIRSGVTPFEQTNYEQILTQNILGNNLGNLLYAASVYKSLCTDKIKSFIPIYFKNNQILSDKEIDRINNTCKYFIIPLADAIRQDFMPKLETMTTLIKSLKIPCCIIGMGIRAPYNVCKPISYTFDDIVKNFISAVLDKSATIGVRGQITADYLSGLGFKIDNHINVIGCPSMYFYGDKLKVKDVNITTNSSICYNTQTFKYPQFTSYLHKQAQLFQKYALIPQIVKELKYIYLGKEFKTQNISQDEIAQMYLEEDCYFFNNVKSWLNFMKTVDFTFGLRLHGCIASLIMGNKVLLFPHDARQKELAEFHAIPSIPINKVSTDKNIFELIERIDFHSPEKVHKQNFDNYVKFLKENNIENIWSCNYSNPEFIFNKKYNKVKDIEVIRPYTKVSSAELKRRCQCMKVKASVSINTRIDKNILNICQFKKLEKIFSVKNKYDIHGKHKILTILGWQYEIKPPETRMNLERERERERIPLIVNYCYI